MDDLTKQYVEELTTWYKDALMRAVAPSAQDSGDHVPPPPPPSPRLPA